MKTTRIAALAVMLLSASQSVLYAQSLKTKGPPAELPPASFLGKQLVDSRGCMYIRAGRAGVVTWVPRVDQKRTQICGQTPTNLSGYANQPAQPLNGGVEVISIRPSTQPSNSSPVTSNSTVLSPAQAPIKARPRAPAPVRTAPVTPQQELPSTKCSGISSLSQQYTNSSEDVRCGPQTIDPLSLLTPDTRIVPKHVYIARQRSADVTVPAGYRSVWNDDRLNQKRAERTIRSATVVQNISTPKGYQSIVRADNRLNTRRGPQTASGSTSMARIWENKQGVLVATQPVPNEESFSLKTVQQAYASKSQAVSRAAVQPILSEVAVPSSSRSQRYVIAGRFDTVSQAKAAAVALSRQTGLPTRIGRVKGHGQAKARVVMAGPFTSNVQSVLKSIRQAGYRNARLTK